MAASPAVICTVFAIHCLELSAVFADTSRGKGPAHHSVSAVQRQFNLRQVGQWRNALISYLVFGIQSQFLRKTRV